MLSRKVFAASNCIDCSSLYSTDVKHVNLNLYSLLKVVDMSEASVDYRPMWTELGLNLEAHDALLEVLSRSYGDIFLSQKNRPDAMSYFDFVMSEVHGLRIKELMDAKKAGRKIIGTYCTFVPEELVLAVDGIMVTISSLCTVFAES